MGNLTHLLKIMKYRLKINIKFFFGLQVDYEVSCLCVRFCKTEF